MNSNGGTSQPNTVTTATETIPLQNIIVTDSNNTLRRQFQGNVYQYVGQRDEPSYNDNHYETASDLQQWANFFDHIVFMKYLISLNLSIF